MSPSVRSTIVWFLFTALAALAAPASFNQSSALTSPMRSIPSTQPPSTAPNLKPTNASDASAPDTSANVTRVIPYDQILQDYIAAKDKDGHRCASVEQRIEWRNLTADQRADWIRANRCLTTTPSVLVGAETDLAGLKTSLHDDFSLVHMHLFYVIHHVAAFFPWHRMFLKARELALRDCGYEGPIPYWNWAIDADTHNVQTSPVFSDTYGVSGNGSLPNGTITTGPFAYLPVSYLNRGDNASIPTYEPHFVARAFGTEQAPNTTYPMFEEGFNSSAVQRTFAQAGSNYTEFGILFEGVRNRLDVVGAGPHGAVHVAIGGEMANSHSPNDPIFFLHHANVDRLWDLFQRGSTNGLDQPAADAPGAARNLSSRFWAYTGNTLEYIVDPTGGPAASLFDMQTVEGLYLKNMETYNLMDTTRPPLCYEYL